MRRSVTRIRQAWIKFLAGLEFTHAVTLKPNNPRRRATEAFLWDAFLRFHRDVDQALLGSRFNRPAKRHLRSMAVGVIEGLPVTGHIHAFFRVPRSQWEQFERLFQPLTADPTIKPTRVNPWEARIVGGSSEVARISDAEGWAKYCSKEIEDSNWGDRIRFLPLDA